MEMEASGSRPLKSLDECTIALDEEGDDKDCLAQRSLTRKVLTEKGLNRGAIKIAWSDPEGVKVSDIGMNPFLFTFQNKEEANEVMKKGRWY